MNGNGTTGTTDARDDSPDEPQTASATAPAPDHAIPFPGLADTEATLRSFVQTYPLLTLAGAIIGGYAVARLLKRLP